MFGTESEVMDAVNLRLDQDKRLIQAILRKDVKQVERLLGKERINPDGHPLSIKGPPLHLAVQLGTTTIVDTLVKYGANINNTNGPFCTTGFRAVLSPLHLAVKAKNSWMIRKLSSLGADADITDSKGTSARQIASQNAQLATVLAEGERAYEARIIRNHQSNKSCSSIRQEANNNLRVDMSSFSYTNLSNKQQNKQDNLRKQQQAPFAKPPLFHRSTPSPHNSDPVFQQQNNLTQYKYRENIKNNNINSNQAELVGRLRQEHSRRNNIFREINKVSQFVENQMSVIEAEKEAHIASVNRAKKLQEQHDRALEEQSAMLNQINLQSISFEKDTTSHLQNITPSSSLQKDMNDKDIVTTLSSPFQQNNFESEQVDNNELLSLVNAREVVFNKRTSNGDSTSLNRPSYSTPVVATYYSNDTESSKQEQISFANSNNKAVQMQIQKKNRPSTSLISETRGQNNKGGVKMSSSDGAEGGHSSRAFSESTALASELTLSPQVSTDIRDIAQSKSKSNRGRNKRPQIPKLDLSQLGLGKSSRQIFRRGFTPFDDVELSYLDSNLQNI